MIRESSNFEETSCDSELSDWQRDNMSHVTRMARSEKKVDKRLINLYMLRKAHQLGHVFGFDNELLINQRSSKRKRP